MIPLVDCSPIAEGAFEDVSFDDYSIVAREIGSAMTGIGMCNLINHGVSMEKVFVVRTNNRPIKHFLSTTSKKCTSYRSNSLNYQWRRN